MKVPKMNKLNLKQTYKKLIRSGVTEKRAKKIVSNIKAQFESAILNYEIANAPDLNLNEIPSTTDYNSIPQSFKSLTRTIDYYMVRTRILETGDCTINSIKVVSKGYETIKKIFEELAEDGVITLNPNFTSSPKDGKRVSKYILTDMFNLLVESEVQRKTLSV